MVAAIIFVAIFFALISVINHSKKQTNTRLEELGKEMKMESLKAIEYSANTEDDKIENFTEKYSAYAGRDVNIYFITGGISSPEVYNYTDGVKNPLDFTPNGNIIETTIEGRAYSFEFKKGKNFYFIITQEKDEEKYILTG